MQYQAERTGTSWKGKLKIAVDALIPQASSFEELLTLLQTAGYEQWAKIHNLKQAANEQTADALKGAEKRLADMAVLIKNITTYQKTKPAYDAYRAAKEKGQYRAVHKSSIILHEAAAKALKAAGISGKLPSVAALQAEYAALQEQKEKLYADYGKLKKQVKEYDVIKRNIDVVSHIR